MPRWLSSAPRKKLPPPTTTAISTRSTAAAISRAIWLTTSGLTPSWPAPNASPESLRRTRRRPVRSVMGVVLSSRFKIVPRGHEEGVRIMTIRTPSTLLRADLEAREVRDGDTGVLRHLGDRELVVLGVVLLEQGDLLDERGDAAFDDLRESRFRLALVAGDLGDDLALL